MSKTIERIDNVNLVHLLHRASQFSEELFARGARECTLTPRQVIVMSVVATEKNPSQTVICARSGIDRSTLADIVKRLVGKKLLTRRRTKEDTRKYAVKLTLEGVRELERAAPVLKGVEQSLLGLLTQEERNGLTAALQKIWRHAEAVAPAA
jgi:DNA-binding MarR family transcriptional regulator